MTDPIIVLVAIGGIVVSVIVGVITATWTLGRDVVSRKELQDCDEQLVARVIKAEHDCGEAVAAVRTKIEQVELWNRDNLANREDVRRFAAEIADNRRRLDQFPAIMVKVDTLWSFVIDRGKLEATDKGLMTRNSPLALTEAGKKAVEPILPDVLEFCRQHPELTAMNEDELASRLIAKFEKKLIEEVCEPNRIYLGACIVMLLEALRASRIIKV